MSNKSLLVIFFKSNDVKAFWDAFAIKKFVSNKTFIERVILQRESIDFSKLEPLLLENFYFEKLSLNLGQNCLSKVCFSNLLVIEIEMNENHL